MSADRFSSSLVPLLLLSSIKYTLRDCQQIAFTTLNRFCPLSKPPYPPVLTGQYQDVWNTNQNQAKNTYPFYIVFQVLKVLLVKICKTHPPDPLFLTVLYQLIHQQISFSKNFLNFIQHYLKKRFVTNFPFLTDSLKPLTPHPLTAKYC